MFGPLALILGVLTGLTGLALALFALAVVGIAASTIGAYYYLLVVKTMYFDEPTAKFGEGDKLEGGLIAAAAYLDGKMREVKSAAKASGLDRIAVLAALNITHELIAARQQGSNQADSVAQHVQALKHKLDGVLSASVK